MRGTDIDDVSIALDAIVVMVEVDLVSYLTSSQQVLKLFHGRCVVCGIVEGKVANLQWGLTHEHIDITRIYLMRNVSLIK